jgi:hypothetical protein
MRYFFLILLSLGSILPVQADIFEHGRPKDSALRDILVDDRQAYYVQTPGIDHQENEESISNVKFLRADVPARSRGLRDMDKAFDLYLREQLQKDRDYKNLVSLNHPLLLLEYSSPVLADVVKHYRAMSYERLGIEQARLGEISRSTEGRTERLSRQSERECLQRNESRGLVAAMRLCQNSVKPLEMLTGMDGGTLEDGRRNIHVVEQALSRLGFDKARIDKIVDLTGDKIIFNDRYEDRLPETTFERRTAYTRQTFIRQWRDVLEKFHKTGRASPAGLEDLSLPGAPVTARVLSDLDLLDEHEREIVIFKFASHQAFVQTERAYRQAAGYLDLCLADPVLIEEFRRIIEEKRDFLFQVLSAAKKDREGVEGYKELLSSVAQSADVARERLRPRVDRSAEGSFSAELMLNF